MLQNDFHSDIDAASGKKYMELLSIIHSTLSWAYYKCTTKSEIESNFVLIPLKSYFWLLEVLSKYINIWSHVLYIYSNKIKFFIYSYEKVLVLRKKGLSKFSKM